jgi:glycogen operon protein
LNGKAIRTISARGERVTDDDFTLWFNAHNEPIEFKLAADRGAVVEIDTALHSGRDGHTKLAPGATRTVEGRSMVVLRHGG